MNAPECLDLARHTDRVRRRMVPCRPGVVTADFEGGWLSANGAGDDVEFPSQSANRVYWLTTAEPIRRPQIAAAWDTARSMYCRRMFVWLAPWACDEESEQILQAFGARRWPYVQYIALARRAAVCSAPRPTGFVVRKLEHGEAPGVLAETRSWYSEAGAAAAAKMVANGICEIHGAFDGERPVAMGLLVVDGDWAYLAAAGTAEEYRGRGAQSSLICSRVSRAAELGVRRCVCETNTTVPISLRNLKRCGFEERIEWCVYRWDLPGAKS